MIQRAEIAVETAKDQFLTKIEHFQRLPHKTKVYIVEEDRINSYNYAGFNPMSANLIMLVSTANITTIFNLYLPKLVGMNPPRVLIDYNRAKKVMLENAKQKLVMLIDIYGDGNEKNVNE